MSRIQGGLQAPIAGSSDGRKYHSNYQLPDEGIEQAMLIGLVVMGTYTETFSGEAPKERKKCALIWEFPSVRQLVYEDDTEKRPFRKTKMMTFSMHEKSGLRKVILALANTNYSEDEIKKLDLFNFIGARCFLGLTHKTYKKDNEDTLTLSIDSYTKVGKAPVPDGWEPDNERYMWFPDANGDNFMTENFAELPGWLREEIMKSAEAIAHQQRGGKFAEEKKSDAKQAKENNAAADVPQVPNGWEFVDPTNTGFSYADYRASGWTDKHLHSKGFLVKKAAPATPPPAEPQSAAPAPDGPPTPEAAPAPAEKPAAAAAPEKADDFDPFGEDDDDLPY